MEFHDNMAGSDPHSSPATPRPHSPGNSAPAGKSAINPDEVGFGVYVHWPFCASKCPYCDFNSHVRAGGVDEQRYLAAYLREIDTIADRIGPRRTGSVFFGGGTPSLMHPRTVGAIIAAIDRRWPIGAGAEITLEANPGSVEAGRFAGYRAAGVDRVSIGVQSLSDDSLRRLGRLHSAAEARSALGIARRTFPRFSFDMIYTRPGQTLDAWRRELAAALDLAGDHLSLYQLTIEDGTPYAALHAAGKLIPPDDDLAGDMFALTQDMTAAAGLPAYEISNHARPGQESRHNLLYWRYGEYAGIGAGAHGRLLDHRGRRATSNTRHPEGWLSTVEDAGCGIETDDLLSVPETTDEALLMGLRLTEGLDLHRLSRLGAILPQDSATSRLQAQGLIEVAGPGRIRATAAGRFVLNGIILQLSESIDRHASRYPA